MEKERLNAFVLAVFYGGMGAVLMQMVDVCQFSNN